MLLTVDTHSHAYQIGTVIGQLIMAALGIIILWIATRKWRNPYAVGPEDHAATMRLRSRRKLQTILGSVGIVPAAFALSLLGSTAASAPAATGTPVPRTVTAPASVGNYMLVTGEEAVSLTTKYQALGARPEQQLWFYGPGTGEAAIIVQINHIALTPAQIPVYMDTTDTQYKLTDVQSIDPGAFGGEVRCGALNGSSICHWADPSGTATLVFVEQTDVPQASAITTQLRTAAEH